MKRVLAVALIFLSVAFCFYSCQKAPELTITSTSSIELSVDGSSGSITFTANRDWTASSSDPWVTISPSSGKASDGTVTVTVRCNANTTYDDRTATVTIRMEDLSKTVTVRQPANKGVILPKQVYDLQSGANSIDVEVQANVQYTVSTSADWIKQTGTKGLTSKTLTFSIEENKTYDSREGKITIKPQDGSVQEQVISVKQAQRDALNVEKTTYDMPYGGGGIEVNVEANVAFDVTSSEEWIHYVETKALSSSKVCLKIDENTTYSSRQGTVEIKQKNGSLKHTITIKQNGLISVESITLDKSSLIMIVGETATLLATVLPASATNKTIVWKSSDNTIVTVSDGVINAISSGNAIITATTVQGGKTATCSIFVDYDYQGDPVDLGLSVKWSSLNLGATSPTDSGPTFGWGETEPRAVTGNNEWESYKWTDGSKYSIIKYCTSGGYGTVDYKTVLDSEDDAATVKLGEGWRLPSKKECEDLFIYCTWKHVQIEGTYSYYYEVTSKINQNRILIPDGTYWTRQIDNTYPYLAFTLSCKYGDIYYNLALSRAGLNPIRPVFDK